MRKKKAAEDAEHKAVAGNCHESFLNNCILLMKG